MKSYSRSARWRVKPHEQRYVLLLGDAFMAGVALFISLYLWAAGDQWLKRFSLQFLHGQGTALVLFSPIDMDIADG